MQLSSFNWTIYTELMEMEFNHFLIRVCLERLCLSLSLYRNFLKMQDLRAR